MSPVHVLFFVLSISIQDSPARPGCNEWHECRQLALEAASRQDYETFHDLAWRAVQTGPRNDPALMYLLARAQSLSGRPGDALVMLQRLAQMGTRTDAATNDDFRRVRALPGWSEFAANAPAAETPAPPTASTLQPRRTDLPEPPSRDGAAKSTNPLAVSASPLEAAPRAVGARAPAAAAAPIESLRFTASSSTPAGIAYDAVSRRFIVGDREASKLTVVDEFSQHVANLASAQTAGFGTLAAFEIDPRQGNLWVVSGDATGAPNSPPLNDAPPAHTTLHKLQLVSGRVLQSFILPERFGAARFSDVAVMPDSTVLVLDASGQRIFRLRPKASDLEVAATLSDRPSTIAPASDGRAYVANANGIVLVDLSSRATTPLKAASGVDLGGLFRLRWHKGALIGIQQSNGSYRAVRIILDSSGRRAIRQQVLDPSLATTDPTAATIAGDMLYYLASGEGAEMVIRKIALP
jgi:DNA-binding beta-propeller fold protein YncE